MPFPVPCSLQIPMFTNLKLSKCCLWVFIEAPLHRYWSFKSLAIVLWTQSPAPPSQRPWVGLGVGLKVSWSSSHMADFPKKQFPSLGIFQKLFFNTTKDISSLLSSLKKSQVFRVWCQKGGQRPNMYFFSQITISHIPRHWGMIDDQHSVWFT